MEGVLSRFDVIHFMDISINNDSHKKNYIVHWYSKIWQLINSERYDKG